MNSNIETAKSVYEAYEKKDRAAIEKLIAEKFCFTSPVDNCLSRKTYLERCWKNSEKVKQFTFIHVLSESNKVFVTYEAENLDGSGFQNTEILTLQDEQVIDIKVYFGWSVPHKAKPGEFLPEDKQSS
jgi:hypothetical protein